jgi:hypothetical protein
VRQVSCRLGGRENSLCLIKEKRNNRGRTRSHGLWEAEGAKKRRRIEKSREESKDGEEMELGHEKQFCRVKEIPVSKLMGKDSLNLLGLRLLNQGVKDDNVFTLMKSELAVE